MRERAHFLRPARVFLSREAKVEAELVVVVGRGEAQTEWIISRQGWKLAQPGSNLKKLDRGIVVVTWTMRGMWSGVKRVRDEREEFGKASSQARWGKA